METKDNKLDELEDDNRVGCNLKRKREPEGGIESSDIASCAGEASDSNKKDKDEASCPTKDILVHIPYSYKPPRHFELLRELLPSNTLTNIIGVVSYFTEPTKSKGSDFYIKLFLIDPSCCRPKTPEYREVLCFNSNKSRLPHIQSCGDIIRFHRIKVSHYRSDIQLLTNHATSFLVIPKDRNEISLENTRHASRNPSLPAEVIHAALQLREWLHLNPDVL